MPRLGFRPDPRTEKANIPAIPSFWQADSNPRLLSALIILPCYSSRLRCLVDREIGVGAIARILAQPFAAAAESQRSSALEFQICKESGADKFVKDVVIEDFHFDDSLELS